MKMEWNLERIQKEVNDFSEHARKVSGKDIYETTKELENFFKKNKKQLLTFNKSNSTI